MRVLVVEDDAVDRLAIRRALGRRAEPDDAHDGPAALKLLQANRYDVALLDYFLPGDTGLSVFARIHEALPALPVIFLSGHGSEEVVVDAMKAGAADYISKAAIEERDRLWRTVTAAVENHRLRTEAERSQARLGLAVEAAGAGTWELDLSWNQFRGDTTFQTLLGLPEQPTWSADQVRERLTMDSAQKLDEALQSKRFAVQVQLEGERPVWVDLRGRQEPDAVAHRIFGTAIDLTQVKEEEARSAALRERLMGIASHDLKNPLSAVLQASALLANSPRLEAREKRYVQHIRTSAERMTHLIVQLLDLTRVRLGGGLPLEKKPTELDQTVKQICDELKLANPDRELKLELDALTVPVDPDRIAQVASNLIGNALKHSAEGTAVVVRLTSSGSSALLEVKNRGTAIPKEMQAQIFEPFVQYGDHSTREGLGLGLYISREIVRAHGGVLTVTSSEEDGTCFSARLPM
ncbi:MAG: response regulator [Myxococcaceae bacterium]|nr:response regulator [Myxococcaceae bacterium]